MHTPYHIKILTTKPRNERFDSQFFCSRMTNKVHQSSVSLAPMRGSSQKYPALHGRREEQYEVAAAFWAIAVSADDKTTNASTADTFILFHQWKIMKKDEETLFRERGGAPLWAQLDHKLKFSDSCSQQIQKHSTKR